MTAATQRKIILRPAPKRIDAVSEKIVQQLALHIVLNKSRMSWCAKAGEIEIALNRLISFGIVGVLHVQRDYNIIDYYFLKYNADLVAAIFSRYKKAIEHYRTSMQNTKEPAGEQITVVAYNLDDEEAQDSKPNEKDLSYVPLKEYMKQETVR